MMWKGFNLKFSIDVTLDVYQDQQKVWGGIRSWLLQQRTVLLAKIQTDFLGGNVKKWYGLLVAVVDNSVYS